MIPGDHPPLLSITITHLFRKPAPGVWVEPCESLRLKRGYGIEGDAHARAGSPRQLLLASQPTLAAFGLRPGDLQENLLLDTPVEALESGRVLQMGTTAQIRLMFLCEPCASLERLQPGISRKIHGKRGLLGMVVQDGVIRPGDRVQILPQRFPCIPDKTRGKFEEFVARIPPGRVVRTPDLLMALGLLGSSARSIPILLKKSAPHLPVHRIVAANGDLLTRHLPDQAAALAAEGISLEDQRVAIAHSWSPEYFHALDPDESARWGD